MASARDPTPLAPVRRPASRAPSRCLAVAVGLLLAAWCLREDVQPDLYFHLAAGRHILERGLPDTNVFLAPHPDHPFVAHEWLSGVGAYALYSLGGGPLLTLAKTLLVACAAAALARAASPWGDGIRWVVLALVIPVAGLRFVLRPEVVSLLGVALHLLVLTRSRGRPGRAAVAGLVLFQVLWSNAHGFSLLGPLVVAGFLVPGLLRRAAGGLRRDGGDGSPRSGAAPRSLAVLLGLELVAALLNPYGPRAAFYPVFLALEAAGGGPEGGLSLQVVEMLSPFDPRAAARPEVRIYIAWAVAAVPLAGWAVARRRLDAEGLVVAAGLFLASAGWVRNLPFGALGLALPTAAGLAALGDVVRARLQPGAWRRARAAALVGATAGVLLLARATLDGRFHENADHAARPGARLGDFQRFDAAVAHLREHPPRGGIFNNFGAGHFLTWALPQDGPRPFISGNVDLYPRAHLRRYRGLLRGRLPFTETLDGLGITCVLLDHRVETPPERIARLHADPAWRLGYADDRCVIFRRAGAGADPPVAPLDVEAFARGAREARYADEAAPPFPPAQALRAVGLVPPRRAQPLLRTHTAALLALLGRPAEARQLLEEARRLAPGSTPVLAVAADLERRHGDPETARELLGKLRRRRPDAAGPRLGLGHLALATGRPRDALAHFRAALARARSGTDVALAGRNLLAACEAARDPVALRRALARVAPRPALRRFYSGASAYLEGELDLAEEGFRSALELEPDLTLARSRLGEVLFHRGELAGAERAYRALAGATPHDGLAWRNLGVVVARRGRPAEAIELWERGADEDPEETLCLVHAARAHHQAGRTERARKLLREALRRDPEEERARRLLSSLRD